ncbi:MAG: TetR/AcrR family transcriptional regulator [Phenylobacterium sp.]|nr:MAG: TetR/AcrR family transcriptional regulator [Phenylobacterium sp.]
MRRVPPFFKGRVVSVDNKGARKPRADSLRNREQLLAAAKAAFADAGADVALEEIARRAGLGIGTFYRHFPTRDALLAAVYQREVEQLTTSADRLLAERPPLEAFEAWLHLLVDYLATKRVVAPALQAASAEGARLYAASGAPVTDALNRLGQKLLASGAVRPGVQPEDLTRIIMGLSQGYDRPDWPPSARRLIAILIAGLRPAGT